MLNLDVRDLGVLVRAAEREEILDKIHDLRMSRMTWAESDCVENEMRIYQNALEALEGPKTKHYAKTWKEAMSKGRG